MSVQFVHKRPGRHPRVLYRFIYPAKLALSRQDLSAWLEVIFEEKSERYRSAIRKASRGRRRAPTQCTTPMGPAYSVGATLRLRYRYLRRGRFPIAQRNWIVHDEANDRLVIVRISNQPEQLEQVFNTVLDGLREPELDGKKEDGSKNRSG